MQLQHLCGHLQRILKQSDSFERTLLKKQAQLKATRADFGKFLKKIHNLEGLRQAQTLKQGDIF